jgi:hypothetical protein
MADARKLAFAAFTPPTKGVLIVFCEEGLKFGPAARKALAPADDLVQRAAAADKFTGKSGSALDIVAPAGLSVSRLVVMGVGKAGKLKARSSPTRPRNWRSARNCAPMCSTATRPSARKARMRRASPRSPSR